MTDVKSGKNIKAQAQLSLSLMVLLDFAFFFDLLLDKPTATWNSFVLSEAYKLLVLML